MICVGVSDGMHWLVLPSESLLLGGTRRSVPLALLVQLLIPCTSTGCVSSTFLSLFFHAVETVLTACTYTVYGNRAEG